MNNIWQSFLVEFCKVDVVCWQGEPNWLGWIIILIPTIFLGVGIIGFVGLINKLLASKPLEIIITSIVFIYLALMGLGATIAALLEWSTTYDTSIKIQQAALALIAVIFTSWVLWPKIKKAYQKTHTHRESGESENIFLLRRILDSRITMALIYMLCIFACIGLISMFVWFFNLD